MLPCIAEFLVFQSHESEHEMNKYTVNIKKCYFYFLFLISVKYKYSTFITKLKINKLKLLQSYNLWIAVSGVLIKKTLTCYFKKCFPVKNQSITFNFRYFIGSSQQWTTYKQLSCVAEVLSFLMNLFSIILWVKNNWLQPDQMPSEQRWHLQYSWSLREGPLLAPYRALYRDESRDRRRLRSPVTNTVPWLQWWPMLAFPHVLVLGRTCGRNMEAGLLIWNWITAFCSIVLLCTDTCFKF